MTQTKRLTLVLAAVLLAAAVGCVAAGVLALRGAAPLSLQETTENGEVYFALSRDRVIFPWQCVLVGWDTTGYAEAWLNGERQPTARERNLCLRNGSAGNFGGGQVHAQLTLATEGGASDTFELAYTVAVFQPGTWALPGIGVVLAGLAAVLFVWTGVPGRALARLSAREQARTGVSPGFYRGAAYVLAGIHGSFAIAIMTVLATLRGANVLAGAALLVLAVAALAAALWPGFRGLSARVLRRPSAALLPFVWFVLHASLVQWLTPGVTGPNIRLRAAFEVWASLVFYWLLFTWVAAYALRRFRFDGERVVAWALTLPLSLVMLALSLGYPPYVVEPPGDYWNNVNPANGVMYYTAQSNPFAIGFTLNALGYPYEWREMPFESINRPIQRPTFYVLASRACQVIDIGVGGYTRETLACSADHVGAAAAWAMNVVLYSAGLVLIYELVRAYTGRGSASLIALMLTGTHALHVWTLSVTAPDYAEVFITVAGLWLLYELLTRERPPAETLITVGLVFGLFTLAVVNPIGLVFGVILAVIMRRFGVALALTTLPLLMVLGYEAWIPLFGVTFERQDLIGDFPAAQQWLWLNFATLPPFEQWRTIAAGFAVTMEKIVLTFGVLAFFGLVAMLNTARYPRQALNLAGLLFTAISLFAMLFQFSRPSHVYALAPFIYGAVGVGIVALQSWLLNRYPRRRWAARVAYVVLVALALAHNLIQWNAWDFGRRLAAGFFFNMQI